MDAFVGPAKRADVNLDSLDHFEGDAALFLARLGADRTQDADLSEHLVKAGNGCWLGGVFHGSVVAFILERIGATVEQNRIADLLREPRTPSGPRLRLAKTLEAKYIRSGAQGRERREKHSLEAKPCNSRFPPKFAGLT